MLDKPAKKAGDTGAFKRLTRKQFMDAWNKNRITTVWMGKVSQDAKDEIAPVISGNIATEFSSLALRLLTEIGHAERTERGRGAFLKAHGYTDGEYEHVKKQITNIPEFAYRVMVGNNVLHSTKDEPNMSFTLDNKPQRYFVSTPD